MIDDRQRREVAARLRKNLKAMRIRKDWYRSDSNVVECGNAAYRNIAGSVEKLGNMIEGNYIHIAESLADLIDRPTCRNASDYQDMFECSECRGRFDIASENGNEYGEVFSTPFTPHFCPNCGAEVER